MFLYKKYLKDDEYSIYHHYFFDSPVSLSELTTLCGWGSNKLIRNGGIRVESTGKGGLCKKWQLIKDPYFLIEQDKTFVTPNKCRTIIIVRII